MGTNSVPSVDAENKPVSQPPAETNPSTPPTPTNTVSTATPEAPKLTTPSTAQTTVSSANGESTPTTPSESKVTNQVTEMAAAPQPESLPKVEAPSPATKTADVAAGTLVTPAARLGITLLKQKPEIVEPPKPITKVRVEGSVFPEEELSPTAQLSPDTMHLGKRSGQRGAEMIAGLRAELFPSPETIALARWSSRAVGTVLMRFIGAELVKSGMSARTNGFDRLIERALALNESANESSNVSKTHVEIAAGFSPRGLRLARKWPSLNVIEIDLPEVAEEKQKRLIHAKINIPDNLKWYTADLGAISLARVLEGKQVDVVAAEGLMMYFPLPKVQEISRGILDVLRPGGWLIYDIMWAEGYRQMENIKGVNNLFSFFRRQAGNHPGEAKSEQEMVDLMKGAGFSEVLTYPLSKISPEIKQLQDALLLVMSQKPVNQG